MLWLVAAAGVLSLSAALYFPGLSTLPFYTKGEPREALVVQEMLRGGGVILPLRNGVEIPSKPPMFHWIAGLIACAAGGVSELTMRLPSASFALLATFSVFLFGASIGRVRSGGLAAVVLATSFEWLRAARISRVDMTLTFFLYGALLLFAIMDRFGVTRARRVAFFACMALATLGKGPIGIALPSFILIAYGLTTPIEVAPGSGYLTIFRARAGNTVAMLRGLAPIPGLTTVIAITGAWYIGALIVGGEEFFVKQVLKENVFRVLAPERLDSGHRHGPFYFIPQFLLGALPWSLMAPAVAWWLWRSRPLDRTIRYLLVWFVGTVALFSLSASKRSVYILPAYPAAALLFGLVLGPGPEGQGPRRAGAWGMMAGAGLLALAAALTSLLALGVPLDQWISPLLQPNDRTGILVAAAALRAARWQVAFAGLAVLAATASAIRSAPGAHWLRGSVSIVAALLALYGGIVAPVERGLAEHRTFRSFLPEVRRIVGEQPVAFYRAFDYGAVYYADRHIRFQRGRLDRPNRADREGRRRHDPYLLMWEPEATKLGSRVEVLATSQGTGPKGRAHLVLVRPHWQAGSSN